MVQSGKATDGPQTELRETRLGYAAAEEHRAAREAVVLFDQSTFGKLLVQGRDAESVLQWLCANDVSKAQHRVVYTGMLNQRGGYESDLTLMRLDSESFLLITGTGQPVRDQDWIRRNLHADEHVTVADITSAYAVISIAGPNSRELLNRVSPDDFSNAGFPHYTHRRVEVGPALVRAARLSYVGELGWELTIPSESAVPVFDDLCEAGGGLGLKLVGTEALSSLRIEKGYRACDHEIGPDDTPLQAGLEFAVCFNKSASFLGLCSDNKRKGYHDGGCSSPSQTQTRTRTAASQSGGRTRWWGAPPLEPSGTPSAVPSRWATSGLPSRGWRRCSPQEASRSKSPANAFQPKPRWRLPTILKT